MLAGLRVALVHDWLTGMRGGERTLEVFCELFPRAPLYTLVVEPQRLSPALARMRIIPSLLQKLPGGVKHYRYYLPLMPWLIGRFRLADCELVLSSSHAVAKGIPVPRGACHVCYVHAPLRYMWHGFDDYFGPGRAALPVRLAARLARPWLQRWDRRSAEGVHRFLVNSRATQQQVRKYYGRESTVVYPPVELERFAPAARREDYYLMVGAFAPNKRVPLAIAAFNRLGLPLRIVGSGQQEAACRALAGPTVTLLGERPDAEIAQLYARARAFIFPGVEDFGITPLEAQASGTPVIAFAAGGALETVTEQTGLFFTEPTADALAQAVLRFERERERFRPEACVAQARPFGRGKFRARMQALLEETLAAFRSGDPQAMQAWR